MNRPLLSRPGPKTDMKHVFWVTEELAGRPGPMKYPWDISELGEHFNTIISLVKVDSRPIVEVGRMDHVLMPSSEFHGPTAEQMGDMNHILDGMDDAREKGWSLIGGPPYLFHCYAGRGRTCTAIAGRLVWQGMNPLKALKWVKDACPGMNVTKAQMRELVRLGMAVREMGEKSR